MSNSMKWIEQEESFDWVPTTNGDSLYARKIPAELWSKLYRAYAAYGDVCSEIDEYIKAKDSGEAA